MWVTNKAGVYNLMLQSHVISMRILSETMPERSPSILSGKDLTVYDQSPEQLPYVSHSHSVYVSTHSRTRRSTIDRWRGESVVEVVCGFSRHRSTGSTVWTQLNGAFLLTRHDLYSFILFKQITTPENFFQSAKPIKADLRNLFWPLTIEPAPPRHGGTH
jgi:hypothetical protein